MKKIVILSIKEGTNNNVRKDEEILNLVRSLDMEVVRFYTQEIKEINKKTYLGSGKIYELANFVADIDDVEAIVCNFELSPLQYKTLGDIFKKDIYDRTGIILDIFAMRAQTKEAKLQVEIARLQYLRARLVAKDADYSQVTSGGGGGLKNKGTGEKQIDLDRSKYRVLLKQKNDELKVLVAQRENARRKRKENLFPIVAIVGYTNAGKSTLLNNFLDLSRQVVEKKVLQENRLFATLETSTRAIELNKYPSFLLTDTVGFISNLPTTLIKAFRSTLEEITEADLLIQVVDVSDSDYENQIQVTLDTLSQIGVKDIPMIYLYNKIDKISGFRFIPNADSIYVSLHDKEDMDAICQLIFTKLTKTWEEVAMLVPYHKYYEIKKVVFIKKQLEKENGYLIKGYVSPENIHKYRKFIV